MLGELMDRDMDDDDEDETDLSDDMPVEDSHQHTIQPSAHIH